MVNLFRNEQEFLKNNDEVDNFLRVGNCVCSKASRSFFACPFLCQIKFTRSCTLRYCWIIYFNVVQHVDLFVCYLANLRARWSLTAMLEQMRMKKLTKVNWTKRVDLQPHSTNSTSHLKTLDTQRIRINNLKDFRYVIE